MMYCGLWAFFFMIASSILASSASFHAYHNFNTAGFGAYAVSPLIFPVLLHSTCPAYSATTPVSAKLPRFGVLMNWPSFASAWVWHGMACLFLLLAARLGNLSIDADFDSFGVLTNIF